MKRLIVTIIIVLAAAVVAEAQNRGRTVGMSSFGRGRTVGMSSFGRSYGYSNYGNYGHRRPSENINVKRYERWNGRSGESSYERSPDYMGKVIDGGIVAILLSIILH